MKRRLLSAAEIGALVRNLTAAVARSNKDQGDLLLVGIQRRGVPLAQRIAVGLGNVPVGSIDITLYRDDLQLVAETPIVRGSNIEFDINDKTVVLVDDVIFTGRTVRAALTELLDFGRPRAVQLLVLIDRGHRELPIQPDFVGRKIETRRDDIVDIYLKEVDGHDEVVLIRKE
ncbi:MAG: bifunctional pyr operon transcriptional regulator/uracil phosphoribosyltransferase PyrR [candidate division WOR-3 bacterium]|jgi:pyrimidine operon attenuation protein/uracil phosphoribosyltransferase|nr:bifunctional pyr operon transcriptional regulator/uracil phosphoribosyltransferase PyrR [candidate division WOR-3 bacterium]MCR4423963.1 bifunctional pyr operon transcriptional regulator/uracil phosphoribosyltransferase PyrR [candidate division WOR-3 bacterium]MDH7519618.1 bifunctional pyr operon transcriptional regulator/uracil phosphoribosyltransferase PyrR [bacterium]